MNSNIIFLLYNMKLIYILGILGILILLFIFYNFNKGKIKKDINDILKNNYYINLEYRKDRNIHTIISKNM